MTKKLVVLFTLILFITCNCLAETPVDKAWGLIGAGSKGKNEGQRAVAVRVLGLIKNNPKAQALAEKGLVDSSPIVRVAAATALRQMGAHSSIPKIQLLLKDSEPQVVVAAAHALKSLNDPLGYEVFYAILTGERKSGAGLVESQKKMLSDPKKMAQFGFDAGVGFIPFASLGLGTIKAMTKDDSSPVRAAAALSLANDPDPRSGQALVNTLSDKKPLVRAAAADAIAQRDDASLLPGITKAMDDKEPSVNLTAAAAVIRLSAKK